MIKLLSALVEATILATAEGVTDEQAAQAFASWNDKQKQDSDALAKSMNDMRATHADLLNKYATQAVDAAVNAKRIKPDAKDAWIKRIVADASAAELLNTIEAQKPAAAPIGHPDNALPGVAKIEAGKPKTGIERAAANFQAQFERAGSAN